MRILSCLSLLTLVPTCLLAQTPRVVKEADLVYERTFSNIIGMNEFADGRILVADAIEKVVAVLDVDGSTTRTIGRVGRGPREFSELNSLLDFPGDSALLVDRMLLRYSVIGPGETIVRDYPMTNDTDWFFRTEASARDPEAIDGSGGVYIDLAGIIKKRGGQILRGDRTPIVRYWPNTNVMDTVAYMSVPNLEERWNASRVSRMFDPGATGFATFNMDLTPFAMQDSWGVMRDQTVVVARVADYHLEFWRNGASIRAGEPVTYDPVPVGRRDRDAWIERATRATQGGEGSFSFDGGQTVATPGSGNDAANAEFPEVKPPFPPDALRVGRDGMIWVQRNVALGAPSEIDVFGDAGVRVYQVILPPDRKLLSVSARYLYAIAYTDLQEQVIERYPL